MNRKSNLLLLLPVLWSLSAINMPRPSGASQDRANNHDNKNGQSTEVAKPLLIPLRSDYEQSLCLAIQALPGDTTKSVTVDSKKKSPDKAESSGCNLKAQLARNDIDVRLAMVPDPKHTRLTLFADRQIDAIMQGAQNVGLTFSSAYLPWDAKQYGDSTDPAVRYRVDEMQAQREEDPGFFAFRGSTGDQQSKSRDTLVFVIGERPTSGPDATQFRKALDRFFLHTVPLPAVAAKKKTAVRAAGPVKTGAGDSACQGPELRILGPTFSGSLPYMERLLTPVLPRICGVTMISGTVSSGKQVQLFDGWTQSSEGRKRVHFASMQESDTNIGDLLLGYYFKTDRGNGIAVLSEDETSYGSSGSSTEDTRKYPELLHLFFPREVSHLRSAYQKGVLDQPQQGQSSSSLPRSTIKLSLEESGSDDDTVTSYSPQFTSSQEAVMLGIVSALRTHHIQAVLIRATDPLDIVFLTEYLRTAYPEAQIITEGNDSFFPHEAQDPKMRGVLSVASYPLNSRWQDGLQSDGKKQDQHVFPSTYSAGTFNAASILLSGAAFNGNSLASEVPLFEYGCPEDFIGCRENRGRPPVVLEAVSRAGYWPVAVLPQDQLHDHTSALPSSTAIFLTSKWQHLSLGWAVFIIVALAAALAYGLLLLARFTRIRPSLTFKLSPFINGSGSSPFFVNALLVWAVVLLCLAPSAFLLRANHQFWVVFSLVLAALVLFTLAFDLADRKRAFCWIFLACAVALLIGVLRAAGAPGCPLNVPENAVWYFFWDRYVHLTSGVSPMLPFLFLILALLWWMSQSIAGMAILGITRPHVPQSPPPLTEEIFGADHDCASFNEFAYLHSSIAEGGHNLLKPLFWYWPLHLSLAIAVVCVLGLSAHERPLLGLEGAAFDRAYFLLFLLVAAVLFSEIARLWLLWKQFQNFLFSLDNTLLRRGFSNLRGFRWDPFWSFGAEFNDLWKLLVRMQESLGCIVAGGAGKGIRQSEIDALDQKWQRVKRDFRRVRKAYVPKHGGFLPSAQDSSDGREAMESLRTLSERFRQAAEVLLCVLKKNWRSEQSFINDDRLDKITENPKGVEVLSVEAEQFVCLVYLNIILALFARIRSVATAIAGLYIFLLLACHSYPFAAHATTDAFLVVLLAIIAVTVVVVYAQMHRNPTLSRITNTDIGKVGADFWLRTATFLALPVISLLAAQFPGFANFLFSWIEPAANALH